MSPECYKESVQQEPGAQEGTGTSARETRCNTYPDIQDTFTEYEEEEPDSQFSCTVWHYERAAQVKALRAFFPNRCRASPYMVVTKFEYGMPPTADMYPPYL